MNDRFSTDELAALLEPRNGPLLLNLFPGQYLQGDDPFQLRVPRFVDCAHAPLAELCQELVLAQPT